MSSVVKTVFGGTDDSAQKFQNKANKRTKEFIEEQAELARGDVLALAPAIEGNQQLGAQAALDVLGQSVPAQVGALFRGEGQAQRNLLGGLSQFERSILGQPGSITAGLGGQPFAPDLAFTRQQLPDFISSQQALNTPQPAIPGVGAGINIGDTTSLADIMGGRTTMGDNTFENSTLSRIRQIVDANFGQGELDRLIGGAS